MISLIIGDLNLIVQRSAITSFVSLYLTYFDWKLGLIVYEAASSTAAMIIYQLSITSGNRPPIMILINEQQTNYSSN